MDLLFIAALIGLAFVLVIGVKAIFIVQQSEVVIVERLGRFHAKLNSGLNVIVPVIDSVRDRIDLREKVVDFPAQDVITKDNATVKVDSVLYYRITDPVRVVYEVANPLAAIEKLSATTLRNIIAGMMLDEAIASRDTINAKLRDVLDVATDKWGVRVERVEIMSIAPPEGIRKAMEKQLGAERERREKILLAEGAREAAIKQAEGQKAAMILEAEGYAEAQIKKAHAEAEAIVMIQKAKGDGLKSVMEAIKERPEVGTALRSLEAMENVSKGDGTTFVIPSDAAGLMGALPAIGNLLGKVNTA